MPTAPMPHSEGPLTPPVAGTTAPPPPGLRLTPPSESPLSASHLTDLRLAHRRSRPLRRAARVASLSGWSTIVLGLAAAPFAIGDLRTLALSLAFVALGYNELCARRALQRFEINAPMRLAISQLMLGGVLIGYAVLSIADLGPITLSSSPLDASLIQGGGVDQEAIESMTRTVSAAVYVGLIVGTVLFQGSTAIYYLTRGLSLRRFLGTTPGWAQPQTAPAVEGDTLLVETFDAAWRIIRDTHYDPDMLGLNWESVRDELRPKALEAETNGQLRAILTDMLSRLGESHFSVIPSEAAEVLPGEGRSVDASGDDVTDDPEPPDASRAPGKNERYGGGNDWLGLDVRVADDRLVVTRVEPGSPAAEAGITPGWLIERIGPTQVDDTLERLSDASQAELEIVAWQVFSEMLSGPPGTDARLGLIDADDNPVELVLTRTTRPGDMFKFGNLPAMNTRLEHRWLEPGEMGVPEGARIGLIRFNIFMMPAAPAFERAVDELRDADGIIIDIRGNLGGIGGLAIGMSRHIVSEPASLGTMTMRGATLKFNVTPALSTSWGDRVKPFDGKLAVVIDGVSASTSEIFAGGLQSIGRARVFGQRTAGMALPANMDRLPNGDVLLHAIADYHDSTGRRLERDGVPPDVPVELNRTDLLNGIDAPDEGESRAKALEIINRHVEAIGGADALREHTSITQTGKILIPSQGISGPFTFYNRAPDIFVAHIDVMALGSPKTGYNGTVGWGLSPMMGASLLEGRELRDMQMQADYISELHTEKYYEGISFEGTGDFSGQNTNIVKLVDDEGSETTLHYSDESGLLIGSVSMQGSPMGEVEVATEFMDYKEFGGVLIATKTVQHLGPTDVEIIVESVSYDEIEDEVFELPPAIQALIEEPEPASAP
eukprot:g6009.t1